MAITSRQRKHLRSLAHHLKPVVLVGDKGVSGAVLEKVVAELENHELIKVKVASDDRDRRASDAEKITKHAQAELVTSIGKVFVLYKKHPKEPQIEFPR